MNLLNESVEHIKFGSGIVKEMQDNKVLVDFQGDIGTKSFQYPEAFDKFLKTENLVLADYIQGELKAKIQRLELEREERQRIAIELREELRLAEIENKKALKKATAKKAPAKKTVTKTTTTKKTATKKTKKES
ncbi:hypothetical protein [Tissierella sp.]|uniref:hypothetical protein n=1 Tax=Tissierella sp. TaxID=41274 RepID=UPI002862B4CE|nr:hypothetical protein [Tissierella sp.]MDR7856525.1 hypothetical protein [Tissierella sp.]